MANLVLVVIFIVLLSLILSFAQKTKTPYSKTGTVERPTDQATYPIDITRRRLQHPPQSTPSIIFQTKVVNIQNQTSEHLALEILDPISNFSDSSLEPLLPNENRFAIVSSGNVIRLSASGKILKFCGAGASKIQTNFESLLPGNPWGTIDIEIRSTVCPGSDCAYLYFASGVSGAGATTFNCPKLDRPTNAPPTTPVAPPSSTPPAAPTVGPSPPTPPVAPLPPAVESYLVRIKNKATLPEFFVHVFAHSSKGRNLYEYKSLPIQTGTDRFAVFPGSYIDITGYRTDPVVYLDNPCGGQKTKAKRNVKYRLSYSDLNPHEIGTSTPNVEVQVDMLWCKKHSCYFISLSGDIKPGTDGTQTDCA